MRIGVVGKQMSASRNGAHELRTHRNELPNQEKGGFNMVLLQDAEQLFRVSVVGSIVIRQRNALWVRAGVDRRAILLRGRGVAVIGKISASCDSCSNCDFAEHALIVEKEDSAAA